MIYSNSEINKLKRVIVHRPDSGIGRITPHRAEELLFDDIVHLPMLQKEHDEFTEVLSFFVDKVIDTSNLLEESIEADEEKKNELIDKLVQTEELPVTIGEKLKTLDSKILTQVLINGYLKSEDHYIFDPIPNFIFTRDIAVTIKDHIVITKAAKEARQRENYLTRFIFYAHPEFHLLRAADRIINMNDVDLFPQSKTGEKISIEGGDIMIFNDDYVIIGCSERTSHHGFESLKKVLLDKKIVDNVVQINIPNHRYCMHIDTLFTQISENDIICYKPIVFDGNSSNVIVHDINGAERTYSSIRDFFHSEINPEMRFIFAGDGISPYQEREQWTDGCNMVAVKPGVALTYDRNIVTEDALMAAGYKIIRADKFMEQVKSKKTKPEDIEKTIITLSSFELSRGRGGSHCMTCPINRTQ